MKLIVVVIVSIMNLKIIVLIRKIKRKKNHHRKCHLVIKYKSFFEIHLSYYLFNYS